jgi:hypothetical protein
MQNQLLTEISILILANEDLDEKENQSVRNHLLIGSQWLIMMINNILEVKHTMNTDEKKSVFINKIFVRKKEVFIS